MTTTYDRIARFYDVDMARNMPFDDAAFYAGICERRAGRALELGCGNGRILLRLLARGVDAIGIDASGAMLDELRRKALDRSIDARVCRMDLRALAFRPGFEVVLCPYSLVTYLTTDRDLERALAEVRRVLVPGGTFVADAFVPRATATSADFRLDYRRPFADATLVRSKRVTALGPRLNRIERRYQVVAPDGALIEQVDVAEDLRPFTVDELRAALVRAGFAVEQTWWNYASAAPLEDAQFHTVVARSP
jgi:SAM-dependent methyltransferase